MYICELCGACVAPRTPCHRVALERRAVEHPFRRACIPTLSNGKRRLLDDPGGRGTQLVREARACPDCFKAGSGVQTPGSGRTSSPGPEAGPPLRRASGQ